MRNYLKKIVEKSKPSSLQAIQKQEVVNKDFSTSFADNSKEEYDIVTAVKPFTMTSYERIFCVLNSIKYIVDNKIEGDIVECGVWKGGSMMAAAQQLLRLNFSTLKLYLYDTFESGMTDPGKEDVRHDDREALPFLKSWEENNTYPSFDEVKDNLYSTGYPRNLIEFVKGDVLKTIPENIPAKISLLRLDTDWYNTTKHEMDHLFPRLSQHGILIIDDYGHWKGARQAVDEYLSEHNIRIFLSRIDYTCRLGIKL